MQPMDPKHCKVINLVHEEMENAGAFVELLAGR
jgi:hypothetical protein